MEQVTNLNEALQFFATNTTGTVLCVHRAGKEDETTCVCDNADDASRFYSTVPIETPQQEFARKFNEGII